MKNFCPSQVFKTWVLCCFIFVASAAFGQQKQSDNSVLQKQKTDKRSDSQKSYVNPRTRDVHRNTGGNNQVVRPADRKNSKAVTTEKKIPLNK